MTDWTNEEEEAFNDVEKHSNLGKQILKDMGQPYHFEVFVSVSQRNQVLEEAAKMCEDNADDDSEGDWDSACISCANLIREMKK
jgi:hypothetical protein